jgi:UDPglucose 6-dehydrogenase
LQKDILALIYLAQCKGLKEVADYWMAVINMNNYRKQTFFKRVYLNLNSNLKGKKLAIFGTAFKKGTCDIRESPAIDICRFLLLEGAILHLVDPKATSKNVLILKNSSLTK